MDLVRGDKKVIRVAEETEKGGETREEMED